MILTRVKQASSEFIKVLRYGKSDVQTCDNVTPHGIDSKPVKNDLAIFAKTINKEQSVCLGYLKNFSETLEGETRIYATDADGVEVFSMFFKRNGTCEFGGDTDNLARFSKLKSGFDTAVGNLNTTIGEVNKIITALNSWTPVAQDGGLALKTLILSNPPVNLSDSVASIDNSKIDEIKTL